MEKARDTGATSRSSARGMSTTVHAPKADGVAAVRGASAGFTVLLLGGVLDPLAAMVVPPFAFLWLPLVAVAGFVTAGARRGVSSSPWLQGATAAVGSYLLILPLVLIAPSGRNPLQITMTLAAAILLGGAACQLRRRHGIRPEHE